LKKLIVAIHRYHECVASCRRNPISNVGTIKRAKIEVEKLTSSSEDDDDDSSDDESEDVDLGDSSDDEESEDSEGKLIHRCCEVKVLLFAGNW